MQDATLYKNGTFFDNVDGNDDEVMPQSNLLLPNRSIFVIMTAALPWRTGRAVNPLLRAAYFTRRVREINGNYASVNNYEQMNENGLIKATVTCHKVSKLSGVLQSYAPEKDSIENVHGVQADFINEGRRRAEHFTVKRDEVIWYPV